MTLNREKILNELGDVMNQLQSADCGCMESLFTPSPAPGMGGHCGHPGCYGAQPMQPPQTMPMSVPTNAAQVLGNCDPTQLYNQTYNYLSENLVKPVVQEVYQDLKSLTPENTMANNPLAQQIIGASATSGASPNSPGMPMGQGNMGVVEQMGSMAQNQMMGGGSGQQGGMMGDHMGGMAQTQMMGSAGDQPISESAQRMGQDWVNEMLGDSKNKPAQSMPGMPGMPGMPVMPVMPGMPGMPGMPDMSALTSEMMGSGGMSQMGGAASPSGDTSPMSGGFGSNAPQMKGGMPSMAHANNPNIGQAQNLSHMSQMENMAQMPQNMLQNMQPHQSSNQYGINEFHKMFPEIQQAGDLGFDPMALAMQMNPGNQKQATIDAMHTMAHNIATTPQTQNSNPQNYANSPQTYANIPQTHANAPPTYPSPATPNPNYNNYNNYNNDITISNNYSSKTSNSNNSRVPPSVMGARNGLEPLDQVKHNSWTHHQQYQQASPQSQQYNNQWQQQSEPFPQQNSLQQQYLAAGTAATTVVPGVFGGSSPTAPQRQVVKEPIFPVDTSSIRYNTLGQPYEEIPGDMIQRQNFPLPQTLSPIPPPVKPMQFGTVKSTISKTALMGMKPVGKQPSRSQLQQIYKQYRGSNSYPNIGGGLAPYREMTNQPLVPLENVGDVSNAKEITIKIDPLIDGNQGGDGLMMAKKFKEEDDAIMPLRFGRRRNGLQDVTPTQYCNNRSPKWSFHGDMHTRPHYTTYRFKPRN